MAHRKNYPCSGKVRHRRVSFKAGKKRISFTTRECRHKAASAKQRAHWARFARVAKSCHKKHDPGTKGLGRCMRMGL